MSNFLALALFLVTVGDLWVYRGLEARIRRLEGRGRNR